MNFVITFLLASCLILLSCTTNESSLSATGGASWYSTMHNLSVNHSAMAPLIANSEEFYNPKNLSFLREKTNEMMLASVKMTQDASAPNADPIISFTSQAFSQELQTISEILDTGKLSSAQTSLSQLGNYCISCHSRADRGSKNFPLPWATQLSTLSSSQKAIYYLANRQYETGHKEVEKIAQDEVLAKQDPNTWISLIQKDLSVVVRVQKDLTQALKLTELALRNKNIQHYMVYDIKAWSDSLKAWKEEDKRNFDGVKNLTFVKHLLDEARSAKYIQGQSGLVLYLRASGILHELLESSRKEASYASTLYFAGITALALKNVDVWNLGEHYFEVCIENAPHTSVAFKCYQQLEHLMLSSHPNLKLLPQLQKRIQTKLTKYKDLSRIQTIRSESIQLNNNRAPGF